MNCKVKCKALLDMLYILLYSDFVEEDKRIFHDPHRHPGKTLRLMLDQKGWTQDDLSKITGVSRQTISNIVAARSGISPEMAIRLGAAFGNTALEWLKWDYDYQLFNVMSDGDAGLVVAGMRRLYELAPIRDMEKRGWIRPTHTAEELKSELTAFFEGDPLEPGIALRVAPRRTALAPSLSPAEIAWCFRARQIAKTMLVERFVPERVVKAKAKLKRLAAHPKEAVHVATVLAEHGVRFIVIEPLPGAKVDGSALWDEIGPIIALSIRNDRIDGFWFTLMHEFEHVVNGDLNSVDSGMVDSVRGVTVSLTNDAAEDRANSGAASALIAPADIDSFIRRVGPLYARDRIVQFANRIRIHPGIIVGQLQNRDELGYSALREFLVKIREHVVSTALTDGWGHSITPIK